MHISLNHLVKRIRFAEDMIKKHPENKDMLEANIRRQKEYIIQCVMDNENNSLLDDVCFPEEWKGLEIVG